MTDAIRETLEAAIVALAHDEEKVRVLRDILEQQVEHSGKLRALTDEIHEVIYG